MMSDGSLRYYKSPCIEQLVQVQDHIDVLFEEYINDLLVVNSNNSLPFDYKSSS